MAKRWHFDALEVVNLFAFRATDPAVLLRYPDTTIGPDNDTYIVQAAARAKQIVCARALPAAEKQRLRLDLELALIRAGMTSPLVPVIVLDDGLDLLTIRDARKDGEP